MKLLNWAKEKVKAVSDFIGRKQYGDIQRFNKLAPIVEPPDREERKLARRKYRWQRWAAMKVGGGPVLTGERLRKVRSQCSPANLTAQPRYRRVP
jgi:hypothetical protein